jgi:transcriptional regulator GlxA family with amidase domain
MSRRTDSRRVQEARRLYQAGMTAPELGRHFGVHERTVRGWLGEQLRRSGPRGRTDVADAKILALRDEPAATGGKPLSFAEIALRVGMSATGVRMRYYALTGRTRPERGKAAG